MLNIYASSKKIGNDNIDMNPPTHSNHTELTQSTGIHTQTYEHSLSLSLILYFLPLTSGLLAGQSSCVRLH